MNDDVLTAEQRELVEKMATAWPFGKTQEIVEMIDGLEARIVRLRRELADMAEQDKAALDGMRKERDLAMQAQTEWARRADAERVAGYHEALDLVCSRGHAEQGEKRRWWILISDESFEVLRSHYARAEPTADEKIALAEELMRDLAAPVPVGDGSQSGEPAKVEVAIRDVVFWSDGVSEELCWQTEDDAVEGILDGITDWPTTLTIHGFARMKADTVCLDPLERCLEVLDEEFGNPDGGEDYPTPAMVEAEAAFVAVVYREYVPWACEEVCQKTVEVMSWVREHRPGWLDGHPMEEAAHP
jgi:hypothetical protein